MRSDWTLLLFRGAPPALFIAIGFAVGLARVLALGTASSWDLRDPSTLPTTLVIALITYLVVGAQWFLVTIYLQDVSASWFFVVALVILMAVVVFCPPTLSAMSGLGQ